MQKSYVSRTTINFVDFEFYIRPGDLLVHDSANHNRLTVYRSGQIVKVVKQTPLGVAAFLKNQFIEEVTTPLVAVSPSVKVSKAPPTPIEAPVPPVEPKKQVLEPLPESKAELKVEEKTDDTPLVKTTTAQ